MKILSADEARLYSEENIRKIEEKEMQNVMDNIRVAVDRGLFHISQQDSLNIVTIKAIKDLGYRVECNQRDGDYTISWAPVKEKCHNIYDHPMA